MSKQDIAERSGGGSWSSELYTTFPVSLHPAPQWEEPGGNRDFVSNDTVVNIFFFFFFNRCGWRHLCVAQSCAFRAHFWSFEAPNVGGLRLLGPIQLVHRIARTTMATSSAIAHAAMPCTMRNSRAVQSARASVAHERPALAFTCSTSIGYTLSACVCCTAAMTCGGGRIKQHAIVGRKSTHTHTHILLRMLAPRPITVIPTTVVLPM